MQNTPFSTNKTLNINGRLIDLSVPSVMGILNVTPDSFYDGGRFQSAEAVGEQVGKMLLEGADIIDVGGYSSRPGASEISVDEEISRTTSAISVITRNFPGTIISIDTFRSAVAEAAVETGASMINDISGGNLDPDMFKTVAKLKVPYILMHMRGTPQTMSKHTQYDHLVKEVIDYFHVKIHALHQLEVSDIVIDPGFGFAKTAEQNFSLLNNLEKLSILGKPILAGLSRKSMIWKTLEIKPAEALNGTTALNMVALLKGAVILRAHDVREARQVVTLYGSLQRELKS